MTGMFETSNRKLEQVLFMLGIRYTVCYRNEDDMTVWRYADTPKLQQIVTWFRESAQRRAM